MPSELRMFLGQVRGARDASTRRAIRLSVRSRLRASERIFQPYNDTALDRYPEVFARFATSGSSLSVLSFGCSVGDELVSLRRYFPAARLVGVDASAANIADCRARIRAAGLEEVEARRASTLTEWPLASFDFIFAMAVFRHGALSFANAPTCRPFLRFSDFEASIVDLVDHLQVGGVLVVEHSNFRVEDTCAMPNLECVYSRPREIGFEATPHYGPDDQLADRPATQPVAFRRVGHGSNAVRRS